MRSFLYGLYWGAVLALVVRGLVDTYVDNYKRKQHQWPYTENRDKDQQEPEQGKGATLNHG